MNTELQGEGTSQAGSRRTMSREKPSQESIAERNARHNDSLHLLLNHVRQKVGDFYGTDWDILPTKNKKTLVEAALKSTMDEMPVKDSFKTSPGELAEFLLRDIPDFFADDPDPK